MTRVVVADDQDLVRSGLAMVLGARGVDVSAYRIVQEALTNALRYGTDRTTSLRVAATPTALSIEATNPIDGPSDARTSTGTGLGLLGIAERVALLGGQLSHGVRDGRFVLTASLPVTT